MPTRSERPTTPPPFDVARYARDSDARTRTVPPHDVLDESSNLPEPRSETRLATRPSMGATTTDAAWARSMVGAPLVVMAPGQLRRLPFDHRAGFLLSLMDGTIDLSTAIEISGMPYDDALHVVRDLFDAGVIDFR